MPSALASLTGQGKFKGRFPEAQNVIVLLIDGMGIRNLQRYADKYPTIQRLIETPGRTTLPSTTPVALASLGTARTPAEHGFLGATFLVEGQLLQPLKWSHDPHPFSMWPETTIFEQAWNLGIDVRRVGPAAYRNSGLTSAVLRGGEHVPAETLDDLIEVLPKVTNPSFTYGYYPQLDRIGHVHGCESADFEAELERIIEAITAIEASMPANTLLVVTADHGMVDISRRIWREDDADFVRDVDFLTGEPRFRHIYTKQPAKVLSRYRKLEDDFFVLTNEQFVELLGSDTIYRDRIGDIVLIAKGDDVGFCSRDIDNRVSSLIGQHGGASDTERDIPIALMAG